MNPKKKAIENWFLMAKLDLKTAKASFKEKIFSSTCFHAQQAAEKLLKGTLLRYEKEIIKTHDLLLLFNKAIRHVPSLKNYKKDFQFLNKFYVPTRYPDAFPGSLPEGLPNEKEATGAIKKAEKIFNFFEELKI